MLCHSWCDVNISFMYWNLILKMNFLLHHAVRKTLHDYSINAHISFMFYFTPANKRKRPNECWTPWKKKYTKKSVLKMSSQWIYYVLSMSGDDMPAHYIEFSSFFQTPRKTKQWLETEKQQTGIHFVLIDNIISLRCTHIFGIIQL